MSKDKYLHGDTRSARRLLQNERRDGGGGVPLVRVRLHNDATIQLRLVLVLQARFKACDNVMPSTAQHTSSEKGHRAGAQSYSWRNGTVGRGSDRKQVDNPNGLCAHPNTRANT